MPQHGRTKDFDPLTVWQHDSGLNSQSACAAAMTTGHGPQRGKLRKQRCNDSDRVISKTHNSFDTTRKVTMPYGNNTSAGTPSRSHEEPSRESGEVPRDNAGEPSPDLAVFVQDLLEQMVSFQQFVAYT
jgi:hypothetical protein